MTSSSSQFSTKNAANTKKPNKSKPSFNIKNPQSKQKRTKTTTIHTRFATKSTLHKSKNTQTSPIPQPHEKLKCGFRITEQNNKHKHAIFTLFDTIHNLPTKIIAMASRRKIRRKNEKIEKRGKRKYRPEVSDKVAAMKEDVSA
ncbi:unnamed protein product [Vicia faba]|uniref:Uncharacterized protein n=1 Tax=Vicia faba TaxID=3906 RepID=A0AAV0YQ63_VICFA|nr:unnamed protein product [Vicia faba]